MFLEKLRVENYRAIGKADLTFNSTTVWIGENESGKSSLIDALFMVLNHSNENILPIFEKVITTTLLTPIKLQVQLPFV
jgi:predicted ATP-dependent endonuclease of OLD family